MTPVVLSALLMMGLEGNEDADHNDPGSIW
jgi:hypothetical protein